MCVCGAGEPEPAPQSWGRGLGVLGAGPGLLGLAVGPGVARAALTCVASERACGCALVWAREQERPRFDDHAAYPVQILASLAPREAFPLLVVVVVLILSSLLSTKCPFTCR